MLLVSGSKENSKKDGPRTVKQTSIVARDVRGRYGSQFNQFQEGDTMTNATILGTILEPANLLDSYS